MGGCWAIAVVPGDEIVPEVSFFQDIGHCDEVGVALSVGHQGVASGGIVWS